MPEIDIDETQLSNRLFSLTGGKTLANVLAKYPDQAMIVIAEQERVKAKAGSSWSPRVYYRDMGQGFGGQSLASERIAGPLMNIINSVESLRGSSSPLIPEGEIDDSGLSSIIWADENRSDDRSKIYITLLDEMKVGDDDLALLKSYKEAKIKAETLRRDAEGLQRTITELHEDVGKVHEYASKILQEKETELTEKMNAVKKEADEAVGQIMHTIREKYPLKKND